ncbi:Fatty acid-binding protein type VII [Fasciolopsis buskii]|uniref:Fatty acid-binding protein type VII n=1 Tax=Fasciolopsis buskii TaxID=27845 RepID=A0A8E0S0A6_9TREM|nr:Fatty acid-binding protein type VII [Fasciolopsis buski]
MSELIGEWKCNECSNLDPVLIEQGGHQENADYFDPVDTNLTIDIEGNEVFLRDDVANRQVGTTFVLDKQIEEMTPDGRIVQSTVSLDSDAQLTHVQRHGFNETQIIREASGDKLNTTVKTGDSVAVLKYERVGEPKDTKQYFTSFEPEAEPGPEVAAEGKLTTQPMVN